jgi:hypothetical protein
MESMHAPLQSIVYPSVMLLAMARNGDHREASFDIGDAILIVTLTPSQYLELWGDAMADDVSLYDLEVGFHPDANVQITSSGSR